MNENDSLSKTIDQAVLNRKPYTTETRWVYNKNLEPFSHYHCPSRTDKFGEFARRTTNCRAISRPRTDGHEGCFWTYIDLSFERTREKERRTESGVQGRGIQVVHNITVAAFYPAVNWRQAHSGSMI